MHRNRLSRNNFLPVSTCPPSSPRAICTTKSVFWSSNNDNNQQDNNDNKNEDDKTLDELLDSPFFDPDQVTDKDSRLVRWFADLVKNDYNTAEALYVGVIFVVMVIVSQELLRMQLYGDNYVPFQAGIKPGQLFWINDFAVVLVGWLLNTSNNSLKASVIMINIIWRNQGSKMYSNTRIARVYVLRTSTKHLFHLPPRRFQRSVHFY